MAKALTEREMLVYREKPLLRDGNTLYYGDFSENFIVRFTILESEKVKKQSAQVCGQRLILVFTGLRIYLKWKKNFLKMLDKISQTAKARYYFVILNSCKNSFSEFS